MPKRTTGRANHNASDQQFEQAYWFVGGKITIALNDCGQNVKSPGNTLGPWIIHSSKQARASRKKNHL
jgi:hypothetical protein